MVTQCHTSTCEPGFTISNFEYSDNGMKVKIINQNSFTVLEFPRARPYNKKLAYTMT